MKFCKHEFLLSIVQGFILLAVGVGVFPVIKLRQGEGRGVKFGGFMVQTLSNISCCNILNSGRIYYIGDNSFLIVSECSNCGQLIAEIKTKNKAGGFKVKHRRAGLSAEKLYKKLSNKIYTYKVHSGTLANEYSYHNQYGSIYNGNGVRIAAQDDFIQMSKDEIHSIINNRFYKSSIKNLISDR